MQKLSLAVALLGTTLSLAAQNCNGSPPASVLATRDPFGASFYYGNATFSYNLFFDLVAQSPISITSMQATCYDQGVGNPVVPNQVGSTAVVNVYTCATTRSGSEQILPSAPNSPWTLRGTGQITVVAWAGESPITFATPVAIPAGTFGVAIEVMPAALGGLHCLGVSPSTTPTVSDSFLTISNQGIQQTGWSTGSTPTGVNVADINLKIAYTPDPQSALFTQLGEGCYFRSRAFHEQIPAPTASYDLSNTALSLINQGPNYLVIPGTATYITPTGTPRNAVLSPVVPAGYAAGGWDDALDAPITLPFTFPFPGGTTNAITISSNGSIFFANVTNGNRAYGYYGALADFRDFEPRIVPFWGDLELPAAVGGPASNGSGNIYYETDNATFARITFDGVEEWTAGGVGPLNTFQTTLYANGQIEIVYGSVSTLAANAIVGFSEGNGNRLPAGPIDLSATIPFASGDGAIPPVLGMDARPVLGTTPNIVTTNITTGTLAQFFVAGLTGLATPVDLGFAGMPGCGLYLGQAGIVATLLSTINPNNTFSVPFTIPNDPAFQNVQFFFQAAPLTPGLNLAGILTSNGVCAKIGL